MSVDLENFIRLNIDLINLNEWDKLYQKSKYCFDEDYNSLTTELTSVLLDCGIDPIKQGLSIIPEDYIYKANIEHLVIPEGVKEIKRYAFHIAKLKNIILPISLEKIDLNCVSTCGGGEEPIIINYPGDYNYFTSKVMVNESTLDIGNSTPIKIICNNKDIIEIPKNEDDYWDSLPF